MSDSPLNPIADPFVRAANAATSGVNDDLLALLVVLSLFGFALVEHRRPFLRPGIRALKTSYFTNVCLFLFNDITLSLLSIPTLYFVAQQLSGLGLLSGMEEGVAKYALTLVLLDFAMYVWHYATHHCDALWVFHKVHHSDRTLNVTTGLRFHMGELFLEVLVRVAFIGLIGVAANAVLVGQTIITLFVLFHHTNVSFPAERVLSKLFIVPRLHRLHHSTLRWQHDSNYGAIFSIWDRMFGTLAEQEPAAIGLDGVDELRFFDLLKYGLTHRIKFKPAPVSSQALRDWMKKTSYL